MSTEETSVQMKIDRAWTTPLPTEPTARLKHGSNHQQIQALRPQPLRAELETLVLKVVLWTGLAASLYLLFKA